LTKDLPISLTSTQIANGEQIQLEANAFVGPLISKNAIELIGYPDEKLFIYGDDTDYTYRISRLLPSYLCPKAIIYHEDPPKVKEGNWGPKSWWKNYYDLRNRFIFVQTHASCRKNKYFGIFILLFKSVRSLIAAIFLPKYKNHRLRRCFFILCAVSDGLQRKKGKRIDPANL
jgi:GT2 family glycosyltransferase